MSEKEENNEYLMAVRARDCDGTKEALNRKGKNTLYDVDRFGNTALHYAVWGVESLEEQEIDLPLSPEKVKWKNRQRIDNIIGKDTHKLVNKENKEGWTPLHFAALLNYPAIVKTLIDMKADVNATANSAEYGGEVTPLIAAVKGWKDTKTGEYYDYNIETIKLLLDAGAKLVTTQNSALLLACRGKTNDGLELIDMEYYYQIRQIREVLKPMQEKLLVVGFNEKVENSERFLDFADNDNNSAVSYLLFNICSVKYEDSQEILIEIVRQLFAWGACIPLRTDKKGKGWTPLSYACHLNRVDVVKLILSSASKSCTKEFLNAVNEHGETALTYAVANGLTEVIPDLLSKGASLYNCETWKILKTDKESLEKFLDNQISVKKDEGSHKVADTVIEFDYQQIHAEKNEQAELTAIQVMEDMVKITPEHKELLKHPMFMALLMRKWNIIKPIYFCWMFSKILFLCFLGTIAIMEGQTLKDQREMMTKNSMTDEKKPIKGSIDLSLIYLFPFTVLLLFMIIVEIFQIFVSLTWWIGELKNWFQLVILILCSLLAINRFKKDPKTAELDLHFLGILLPMVFYECLRELGYHPSAAKFVLLLDKVSKTFFKYGIVYIGLVITPAISFFLVITPNEGTYPTEFSKLLAKTFVMFVGEVELFDVSKNSEIFKWLQIFFFLYFIFFLAVVLMNLLNALAIADTKELLEDAEMEMLHSLLETISFWENLKEGDPHRRLTWSLFKVMNMRGFVRCLIPDLTCFSICIWPFCEKEKKNMSCSLFFCKKREGSKMCDQNGKYTFVYNSNNDVQNGFGNRGKDIVTGALKIFNKKNETDKICQKEEEESQKEYESGWYLEVGPIWNHKHAYQKAEEHTSQNEFEWTGFWNTTRPGEMSVIGVKRRAESKKLKENPQQLITKDQLPWN